MFITYGSTVFTKKIESHELTFGDFMQSSFFRDPTTANVTLEEWHALPKTDRDLVKDNWYFTPAYIEGGRRLENVKHISFVVLDIEKVLPSTWPVILPYNFIIHSTFQSTIEEPRYHLIVESDGSIDPSQYIGAVNYIAELIGLPEVNTESKICAQPIYFPKLPKEADQYYIETVNSNKPLNVGDIPNHHLPQIASDFAAFRPPTNVEPNFAMKSSDYFLKSGTISTFPQRYRPSTVAKQDNLQLFHHIVPPIHDIDEAYCRECLSFISASCSYHEWIQVAAALRHQFAQEPETGFEIFNRWSKTSPQYETEKSTYEQYYKFIPDPADKKPITFRSVRNAARSHGFEMDRQVPDVCHDVPELDQKSKPFPAIELERPAPFSIEAEFYGVTMIPAGKWYSNHYYVINQDKFFDLFLGALLPASAYNNTYSPYLTFNDEKNSKGVLKVKSKPMHKPHEYVLNTIRIPQIFETIYEPARNYGELIFMDNRTYLNTYRTTQILRNIRRKGMDQPYICLGYQRVKNTLDEHFEWLLPQFEHRTILKDFLAYCIQNPGEKINWAIILQGAQGCGKSFLKQLMQAILHQSNVSSVNADILKDKNTGWACDKQLVFIEEMAPIGKDTFIIMDKLKEIISNPTFTYVEKYMKSKEVRNIVNIMMFSNRTTPVLVKKQERRYSFLRCYAQSLIQRNEKPQPYFDRLFSLLLEPESLCQYFNEYVISENFNPKGNAPRTIHNAGLEADSLSPVEIWLDEVLEDGNDPLIQNEGISLTRVSELLQQQEQFRNINMHTLCRILREMGYRYHGRVRFNNSRNRYWVPNDFNELQTQDAIAQVRAVIAQGDKSNGQNQTFEGGQSSPVEASQPIGERR